MTKFFDPSHRRTRHWLCLGVATLTLTVAAPALAQDKAGIDAVEEPYSLSVPARTPPAPVRAGERQTRDQTKGILPMARISSRISSRIESRVRNRIDRSYANASSSIDAAGDRTRNPARP
jgi:hypothetical protein